MRHAIIFILIVGTSVASANPASMDYVSPGSGFTERLRLPKPVKSIDGGMQHTLVLYRDGTVDAWGMPGPGQCDVPDGLKGVKMIAAGRMNSAALRDDGTIAQWGLEWLVGPDVRAKWIDCFPSGPLAAVLEDGSLRLWGARQGIETWSKSIKGATQLAAYSDGLVVLLENGEVVGYPADKDYRVDGKVVQLQAGNYHASALTDKGVIHTWGNLRESFPLPTKPARQIAAGSDSTIAILKDGTVLSHSSNDARKEPWHEIELPAWAREAGSPIGAARVDFCSYFIFQDGSICAYGREHAGQTCMTKTPQKPLKVVGGERTMLMRSDHRLVIWPDSYSLRSKYIGVCPAGMTVRDIARGSDVNVVLLENGQVECWGLKVTSNPAVIAIAAGASHSLALTGEGRVIAWGRNDRGQSHVGDIGKCVAISAAFDQSAALTAKGRAIVWGTGSDPPVNTPPLSGIACGLTNTYGITKSGQLILWDWKENKRPTGKIPVGVLGVPERE